MSCRHPGCLRNYDFDRIAYFAKKRFVDGYNTISLLQQAKTEREKEEIAVVCLLDVEDDQIRDLKIGCKYSDQCQMKNCRDEIRKLINLALADSNIN